MRKAQFSKVCKMKSGCFVFVLFMQRIGLYGCLPLPQDNGINKPKDNGKAGAKIVKSAAVS